MTTPTAPTTSTTPPAGGGAPPPAGTGATPPAGAAAPADAISQALALESSKAEGDKKPAETEGDKNPGAETKQPEAKKDGAKEGEKKDHPAALELKVPDGFEVDAAQLDAFKDTAAKHGLKPEAAQAVLDQYVALETARVEASEKALSEQETKWATELKADPDLGGDKWPATVREVRAGVEFLGKDLGQFLVKTGLGNNPVIVKALVRIGRANADDTIKGTEKPAPAGGERVPDHVLFYAPPPAASKD